MVNGDDPRRWKPMAAAQSAEINVAVLEIQTFSLTTHNKDASISINKPSVYFLCLQDTDVLVPSF